METINLQSALTGKVTEAPVSVNKTSKSIAIDILRAIAALGVFFYHTHVGTLAAAYSHISFLGYIDIFGALYAVPLFFLLSGYCIHASNIKYVKTNSHLPLREYYLRRILRIYPPYFIALLISLAANYIVNPIYKVGSADFLIHLFSLQGFSAPYFNTVNVVFWTISIELAFYTIYPVFYYLRLKFGLNYSLISIFVVSCVSIVIFIVRGGPATLPQFYNVFNLWFGWCCGAFLADKKLLNPDDLKQPVYIYIYSVILIAFVYLVFFQNNFSVICYQFKVLIWTAPLMLILSQEKFLQKFQNNWIVKLILIFGISSYSLYLLHEPLLEVKNWVIHKYLPVKLQFMFETVGVFAIPFIAFLNYRFVEKPFLNLRPSKK
jgi:peptidoglycan/LPS O-acetylase OafA/YrhL